MNKAIRLAKRGYGPFTTFFSKIPDTNDEIDYIHRRGDPTRHPHVGKYACMRQRTQPSTVTQKARVASPSNVVSPIVYLHLSKQNPTAGTSAPGKSRGSDTDMSVRVIVPGLRKKTNRVDGTFSGYNNRVCVLHPRDTFTPIQRHRATNTHAAGFRGNQRTQARSAPL